jgi:hypothetical protein
MSWQPIETVPKGVDVLIALPDGSVMSAKLSDTYRHWQWMSNADLFECFYPQIQGSPTHWMPLPEGPK